MFEMLQSPREMSHADAIQKNNDVLLRCTTINYYVIDCLRAEDVLDRIQEAKLKGKRNTVKKRILLFQWLKELSSHKYQTFLQVMDDTEQEHVANLLRGSTEEDHLPLSDARHTRLEKIRPKIAHVIHSDSEVIAELRSLNAISRTDVNEIRAEKDEYVKSSKLISAIMRRSNQSYDSFQKVLRKTLQTPAAEFLSEGEMSVVHLNNNRPDLDGPLSRAFNETIRSNSECNTDIKELLTEMNGFGLNPVRAIPGQSIVIFIYCKTVQSAVKFTQLFNSGILQYLLDGILSRLLLTIEPHNTKELNAFISLEDEEIANLEEFTGIEGWKAKRLNRLKSFEKICGRDALTQRDKDLLKKQLTDSNKECLDLKEKLKQEVQRNESLIKIQEIHQQQIQEIHQKEIEDLCRTPGTGSPNPRGSVEHWVRNTGLTAREIQEEKHQQREIQGLEKYRAEFLGQHYIHQHERSKQKQLESVGSDRELQRFLLPPDEYHRMKNLNELPMKCLQTILLKAWAFHKGPRKAQQRNLASVCAKWTNIVVVMLSHLFRVRPLLSVEESSDLLLKVESASPDMGKIMERITHDIKGYMETPYKSENRRSASLPLIRKPSPLQDTELEFPDWMKFEKTKSHQSGRLLTTHFTEVEGKRTTETSSGVFRNQSWRKGLNEMEERFEKHREFLVYRIDPEFGLLDKLLASRILTRESVYRIKRKDISTEDKNRKLLDLILKNKKANELVSALTDSGQTHLVNYLNADGGYRVAFGDDWPLSESEIRRLEINRERLVDLLDTSDLCIKLFSKEVINNRQKQFIFSKPTDAEKNEALLNILTKCSLRQYKKTIACLNDTNQSHSAELLSGGGTAVVRVHPNFEGDVEKVDELEENIITRLTEVLENRSLDDVTRLLNTISASSKR